MSGFLDIVRCLDGGPQDIVESVYRDYVTRVVNSTRDLLAGTADGQRVIMEITRMSNVAFERLMLAPETFNVLLGCVASSDRAPLIEHLERACEIAALRENSDQTEFVGPFPVDSRSPMVIMKPSVGSVRDVELEAPKHPSPDQRRRNLAKLEDAWNFIAEHDPAISSLAARHVRVIISCSDESGSFRSSSCNAWVGRMTLLNAHLPSIGWPRIASALIHESIHAILYRFEQAEPLTRCHPSDDLLPLVSPWTGGRLNLHSFVHACVVWAGIASFWRRHLHVVPEPWVDAATERCLQAERGFDGRRPLEILAAYRGQIHPEFMGWLELRSAEIEQLGGAR